jgi:tetratricopeptide (TPR) repeat protein
VVNEGLSQALLSDFDDAIDLDQTNGDAYNGRGLVRARLGQWSKALRDAAEAARHVPANPKEKARWLCGQAHIHAQVVAALKADPQLADRERLRGHANFRNRALGLLRQAVELTPADGRKEFWQKYIAPDPWLAPIRDGADYAKLERDARGAQ